MNEKNNLLYLDKSSLNQRYRKGQGPRRKTLSFLTWKILAPFVLSHTHHSATARLCHCQSLAQTRFSNSSLFITPNAGLFNFLTFCERTSTHNHLLSQSAIKQTQKMTDDKINPK